ncbi:MAG TPA: adenylate/guanylate cyclase domain-containing protein [Fimbriimonadaceae bacterium]|nr:adenylate/guanylate cyclase domain-containing protein [Fimbriimonadaceae bacterium]
MDSASTTLTFLFTDIEGSSRMWEHHPEDASEAIAKHDEILRAILGKTGHVFKTVGDAFCVAYKTAPDGLAAAVHGAEAIQAQEWPVATPIRVRFALHSGTAEARNNDYFGPTLNRVSRILSTGYGGQILLSEAAFALVRDVIPEGVIITALGEHRLRDLTRPEVIFQAHTAKLPTTFPALKSLERYQTNLPTQVTNFVGREDELDELRMLLLNTPLITVLGFGGCGKTRLALQVASDELDRFRDGAWFIDLASVVDGRAVASTVASTLGLRESPGRDALESILEHLANRELLILFDNCEHVAAEVAKLVQAIIDKCPLTRVLATSREALGVRGEHVFRIRWLTVPNQTETHTPETISQYESVRLFINRAVSSRQSFAVTNQNAAAVAEVCCRLEGIPLAIELAAARTSSMSVEDLLRRLDDLSRILVGKERMAPQRHQTLHALINWSYQLLSDREQLLLRRLSVFVGGWSLESAEEVCGVEPLDDFDVLDLLASLVDKSLVTYDDSLREPRYRMLETIRQFSSALLTESGMEEETRRRHFRRFCGYANRLKLDARNAQDSARADAYYSALAVEHPDVHAAIEWAFGHTEHVQELTDLCVCVSLYWERRAISNLALQICTRAVAMAESAPSVGLAAITCEKTRFQMRVGAWAAAGETVELAIERAHAEGDGHSLGMSLYLKGWIMNMWGKWSEAFQILNQVLAMAEAKKIIPLQVTVLSALGLTASSLNDRETALEMVQRSLALARTHQSKASLAQTLTNVGVVFRDYDRLEELPRCFWRDWNSSETMGT